MSFLADAENVSQSLMIVEQELNDLSVLLEAARDGALETYRTAREAVNTTARAEGLNEDIRVSMCEGFCT